MENSAVLRRKPNGEFAVGDEVMIRFGCRHGGRRGKIIRVSARTAVVQVGEDDLDHRGYGEVPVLLSEIQPV